MRFITYIHNEKSHIGVLTNDLSHVIPLDHIIKDSRLTTDMNNFICYATNEEHQIIRETLDTSCVYATLLTTVKVISPIPKPLHDILCVGVNYKAHLAEASIALNDGKLNEIKKPVLFSKRAAFISGNDAYLDAAFSLDSDVDYESELAVIIGKGGKNISRDDALNHIWGYSVFNDFSSRTLQREYGQWFHGKSLDGYSSMGPCIITVDEFDINEPHEISSFVNGELRQQSTLKQMVNTIPEIIEAFSAGMTLEAGDIIATGTPAGVGMGFDPPKFLVSGDTVICKIEGIGKLKTTIR
ncbi:MAG: fumarylacetoacetate hydrolase family protein [Suipraeoptans sp.]